MQECAKVSVPSAHIYYSICTAQSLRFRLLLLVIVVGCSGRCLTGTQKLLAFMRALEELW